MKVVIVANGEANPEAVRDAVDGADLVVAADGGLRHLLAAGMSPGVVVGDFDSAPNELVQLARQRGAEIIQYPVAKDKTDLELALDLAVERGAHEVVVIGAIGGRIDHQLGNVLLLASPAFASVAVRIVDRAGAIDRTCTLEPSSGHEILAITGRAEIRGRVGDVVSLLPLNGAVTGITTTGLLYPLTDEGLALGSSRGMSNVLTCDPATVRVGCGVLLAVHICLKPRLA